MAGTKKILPAMHEKGLEVYFRDINRYDLLSREEEVELAQRIDAGDEEALQCLVRANLRFVVSVAKRYLNQGLMLSDLINEGNLGLLKAARRFDEKRGYRFIQNDKFDLHVNNASIIEQVGPLLNDGKWHHIAMANHSGANTLKAWVE